MSLRDLIFGQKSTEQAPKQAAKAPADPSPELAGHQNVLDMLRRREKEFPLERAQMAGYVLRDLVTQMVNNEGRVRLDDVVSFLASTGGFSCALAALHECSVPNYVPADQDIVLVRGKDGLHYFFGNTPNRYLLESNHALLSLVMGAAQEAGAKPTIQDAHDVISHVVKTVGTPDFGVPRLPPEHNPRILPIKCALMFWPDILKALRLYEVKETQYPLALGCALYGAILEHKSTIDPATAMKIAIECAVPCAKISPSHLGEWRNAYLEKP